MTVLRAVCLVVFSTLLGQAAAAEGDAARAAIQKVAPLQQISAFRKSALPGYFEGVIAGQVAYASADGRYLLRGSVEDTEQGISLSEASMASTRREKLDSLDSSMRLSFSPPQPKYRLIVFTDVDCPFCRRLHSRIDEYNALGIAFDYVFFPLSIHPGADLKSVAVWCSADRQQAYTAALRGQSPGSLHCPNPLAQMRQAGSDIGVMQTPTAIAEDGSVIDASVLMSPHRLLAALKEISEKSDPSSLAATAADR